MSEGLRDTEPMLEATTGAAVEPSVPGQAEITILRPEEYVLVEKLVVKELTEHQLAPETIQSKERQQAALVIGRVLAEQVATLLPLHEEIPQSAALLKVPGSLQNTLKHFYEKSGDNLTSRDQYIREKAAAYQAKQVQLALRRSPKFPEVRFASLLSMQWQQSGFESASASATALLATYGGRIADIEHAARQNDLQQQIAASRNNWRRRW